MNSQPSSFVVKCPPACKHPPIGAHSPPASVHVVGSGIAGGGKQHSASPSSNRQPPGLDGAIVPPSATQVPAPMQMPPSVSHASTGSPVVPVPSLDDPVSLADVVPVASELLPVLVPSELLPVLLVLDVSIPPVGLTVLVDPSAVVAEPPVSDVADTPVDPELLAPPSAVPSPPLLQAERTRTKIETERAVACMRRILARPRGREVCRAPMYWTLPNKASIRHRPVLDAPRPTPR